MSSRAVIKVAQDLLDRFFRDAEGKTNRQIDVYFTLEDMGLQRDKAEEGLEFLTSRGLVNMFGPDIAFLTELGTGAITEEKDISKLPKQVRDFATQKPNLTPEAAPKPPPMVAPPDPVVAATQDVPESALPPNSDRPLLRFTDLEGAEHIFHLGAQCSIGRVEGNTIHLQDQRASKKHAEISWANSHYVIKDLGAANGTVVNGEYIDSQRLQHGDRILIGRTTLTFEAPLVLKAPGSEPIKPAVAAPTKTEPDLGPTRDIEKPVPPPPQPKGPKTSVSQAVPVVRVIKGEPEPTISGIARTQDLLTEEPPPPVRSKEHSRPADLFAKQPRSAHDADLFADDPPTLTPSKSRKDTEEDGLIPMAEPRALASIEEEDKTPPPRSRSTAGELRSPAARPTSKPKADEHGLEETMVNASLTELAKREDSSKASTDQDPWLGADSRTPQDSLTAPEDAPTGDLERPRLRQQTVVDAASQGGSVPSDARATIVEHEVPALKPIPRERTTSRAGDLVSWADHAAPTTDPAAIPQAPEGEVLPDAAPSLANISVLSIGGTTSSVRASESSFLQTLRNLRSEVETADLPDRDRLLSAIEVLERHPYVRVALAAQEPKV